MNETIFIEWRKYIPDHKFTYKKISKIKKTIISKPIEWRYTLSLSLSLLSLKKYNNTPSILQKVILFEKKNL